MEMSIDEFLALVHDELGLEVMSEDVTTSFAELPGWDSMYLLWLQSAVERRTGRAASLRTILEANSLEQFYKLAVV